MPQRTTSKAAAPQIKPAALRRFHAALATWYAAHGRHDLPWRLTDDPYRIWLSEVMLQQTQVSTVLARFYGPFLAKFPTVQALAAAPREAVMKAWEGLGYYRRAGNLHEAAKIVATASLRARSEAIHLGHKKKDGLPRRPQEPTRNDGDRLAFPNTVEDLLKLPGIGKNTAHAIAAFAYQQPVAILEANVKRVVARIFALETPDDKTLWAGAEQLLNHAQPFDYNQAMMDIGSRICTPKHPKCGECPAAIICTGKVTPQRYPTPKAKKHVPTHEVAILVREDAQGRYFLEARDAALLGGLYGFPQQPLAASSNAIGTVTHVYSHFKLIGTVLHERVRAKTNSPDWYSREEIAALPLSKLDHKVLSLVENCHSGQKKHLKPAARRRAR